MYHGIPEGRYMQKKANDASKAANSRPSIHHDGIGIGIGIGIGTRTMEPGAKPQEPAEIHVNTDRPVRP